MNNKAIAFIGHSGSGKTTLINRLLSLASPYNLKVGVIKHTSHELTLPTGKDSTLYLETGAVKSLVLNDKMLLYTEKISSQPQLSDLLEEYYSDCDLIFIEGCKHEADIPKIEVYSDLNRKLLINDSSIKNICGLITDSGSVEIESVVLPKWQRTEVSDIMEFIINRLNIKKDPR